MTAAEELAALKGAINAFSAVCTALIDTHPNRPALMASIGPYVDHTLAYLAQEEERNPYTGRHRRRVQFELTIQQLVGRREDQDPG